MKITLAPSQRLLHAIQSAHTTADQVRPGGLHLSTIVQDYAKAAWPELFDRTDIDDPTMFFEFGNVIEDILSRAFVQRIPGWVKPAPVIHDGVICSPDGFARSSHTIDEVKACWKSSRGFVDSPKWQMYVLQGLGYVKAFHADRLRLTVVFMNGDWRPPKPAPPQTWILTPTRREVRDNWDRLMQHAADRGWR